MNILEKIEIFKKYKKENKNKKKFNIKNSLKKSLKKILNCLNILRKQIILSSFIISFIYILKDDTFSKISKISCGVFFLILIIDLNLIISLNFLKKGYWWGKNKFIFYIGSIFFIILDIKKYQKILFEIFENIKIGTNHINKNITNRLIVIGFVIGILIYLGIKIVNDYKDWKSKKSKRERLLSFRKEELIFLEKLVKDKEVSSILLDNKIGNGKTKLLETLIEVNKDSSEIIYLKLPLINNLEVLKNIFYKEIKKVFYKNNIRNSYLKDYILNISSIKSKFLECSFSFRNNNWETIQEFKRSLEDLEKKGKKILVVLDDIERVEDILFIKDSIFFLGEISECFRDTQTTIIYAAQYDEILKKFKTFKGENKLYNFDVRMLDKYFQYKFTLKNLYLNKLTKDDLDILISEHIKDESKRKEYLKFILILVNNLEKQGNIGLIGDNEEIKKEEALEKNINIRNLKRYLMFMENNLTIEKINKGIWALQGIFYLVDVFFEEEMEEKTKLELFKELFKKVIQENIVRVEKNFNEYEIRNIRKDYIQYKEFDENLLFDAEKLIEIINNESNENKQKERIDLHLNYSVSKVVLDYIFSDEKEIEKKFNKALEKNIEFEQEILISYLVKFSSLDFLSQKSMSFLEKLLEKRTCWTKEEKQKREQDARDDYESEYYDNSISEACSYKDKLSEDAKKLFVLLDGNEKLEKIEKNISKSNEIRSDENARELGFGVNN